ncbi:YjbH domain-containing protein [Marinobacter sp.]|uniref:YjbH domain-containing protein n=1 Tax=Marinobacter sp. TaxID=50741 RepID=UPI0019CAA744|nr:YjbH domain-containing protein [Marinobacter sp.]MBD3655365.1 YjbH domain-containing protein [Marinobacter sp.]
MTSKHWTLVGGAVACLKSVILAGLAGASLSGLAHATQRDLAFPGYSGFLNVPSATVLSHGQADVQYSDQAFNTRSGSDGYGYYNNVSGTFGIFPYVEVGGRLTWEQTQSNCYTEGCGIRDLSANLKIQAPFIPEDWFTVAAGVQDLGGETDDFESVYVVAGKTLGSIELALGYGDPKTTPRYLDGAFGAVSYRPLPWLNLMAEYDSQDVRLGVGASSPQGWLPYGLQVKAKVLAYDEGDSDNGRNFFSVGVSMPFGNAPSKQRLQLPAEERLQLSAKESRAPSAPRESTAPTSDSGKAFAQALGQQLVAAGYDRVSVASEGNTLHVQWENNIYLRDERDSIVDVAKRVRPAAGTHAIARLTLLNQNIPVAERTVVLRDDPANAGGADENGASESGAEAREDASKPYAIASRFAPATIFSKPRQWDFEGSYGPTWKPRITLSPTISSGVATEYGVWDASVGISAETAVSLWTGALASATYNAEIYATEDFEKGAVFYNDRQRTDLIEAEVQQTFKLHPQLYTSFHAGRYAVDWDGLLNETLVLSPNGRHSLGYLGGTFRHSDYDNVERDQMLARYSYYNPQLDTQFDVYGGQFFAEDTGVRIDSRFWFGDYALTLSYKNTDAEFISLGWVIPLTPTKTKQFRYAQIRGNADWNYNVQTRINEDRNLTAFGGAAIVRSANPIQYLYLNRGRLPNQ